MILCNSSSDINCFWSKSQSCNIFQNSKTCKNWTVFILDPHYLLRYWASTMELQFLDPAMTGGGGGGLWAEAGIGTYSSKQKVKRTGHLLSAQLHYYLGNKNGWSIVSWLLNAYKPVVAPSNSEKAYLYFLLIVISESLNCGHDFSFQLFFYFNFSCKSSNWPLWVLRYRCLKFQQI